MSCSSSSKELVIRSVAGSSGSGAAKQTNAGKPTKSGYKHWTKDETKKLLATWEEPEIAQRIASKKSRGVYGEISTKLGDMGVKRTETEVHTKIRHLTSSYKTVSKNWNLKF